MTTPTDAHGLVGGFINLFVRADSKQAEVQVASTLTKMERQAVVTQASVSKAASAAGTVQVESDRRVLAAHERVNAATARYNALLQAQTVDVAKLATAHASQLTAQERLATTQSRVAREQQALGRTPTVTPGGIGFGGTAALLAGTYAVTKIVGAFRDGTHAAEDLQRAEAQTNVTLEATGNIAGISAEHVGALSEEISKYGGVTDTQVRQAENQLLQFTGIHGEIFDRTLKTATDVAAAQASIRGGNVDVVASARSLGLALQDPAKGLDRLRRSGLAFTAQQKDQIKALADAGKADEARALILDFVNAKVAGSAKAFGDSTAGGFAKAHVAEEEFTRAMATSFLPEVTSALHDVTKGLDFLTEHPALRQIATDAALAAGGILIVSKATQALQRLRQSELLSIAGRMAGYRSLARAEIQTAAAEDRHAESAGRAAAAEERLSVAQTESTVTAGKLAPAQERAATAEAERAAVGARGGRGRLIGTGVGLGAGLAGVAIGNQIGGSTGAVVSDAGTGALFGSMFGPEGAVAGALVGTDIGLWKRHKESVDAAKDAEERLAFTQGKLAEAIQANADRQNRAVFVQEHLTTATDEHRHAVALDAAATSAAADKALAGAKKRLAAAKAEPTDPDKLRQLFGLANFDPTADPASLLPDKSAIDSAQSSLDTTTNSLKSSRIGVSAAEKNLADVRKDSKHTADELRSAEDRLAKAKLSEKSASTHQADAEKHLKEARKGTALSLNDVLGRFTKDATAERTQAADIKRLFAAGITTPVAEAIEGLDKSAPGTLHSVASSINKKTAAELNRELKVGQSAADAIARSFRAADIAQAQAEAKKKADAVAKAYKNELKADLADPVFKADIQQLLGGVFEPLIPPGLPGSITPGIGKPPSGADNFGGLLTPSGLPPTTGFTPPIPVGIAAPNSAPTILNFNAPTTFQDTGAAAKTAQQQARTTRLTGTGGRGKLAI